MPLKPTFSPPNITANLHDQSPQMTDSLLNRRQFLKGLLASSLATLSAPNLLQSIAEASSSERQFFLIDLGTGKIEGDPKQLNSITDKPGSVMKTLTGIIISENNSPWLQKLWYCRGQTRIGNEIFYCAKAHGYVDLVQALGYSCNGYFAQAATEHSPRAWEELWNHLFPHNKMNWKDSTASVMSLGLADENEIMTPAMALELAGWLANKNKGRYKKTGLTISDSTWDVIYQGMRLAGRGGTATRLDPANKWRFAGKTGTIPHGKHYSSWLIGFFPYDKPEYALCSYAPVGTSAVGAVPHARTGLLKQQSLCLCF